MGLSIRYCMVELQSQTSIRLSITVIMSETYSIIDFIVIIVFVRFTPMYSGNFSVSCKLFYVDYLLPLVDFSVRLIYYATCCNSVALFFSTSLPTVILDLNTIILKSP